VGPHVDHPVDAADEDEPDTVGAGSTPEVTSLNNECLNDSKDDWQNVESRRTIVTDVSDPPHKEPAISETEHHPADPFNHRYNNE